MKANWYTSLCLTLILLIPTLLWSQSRQEDTTYSKPLISNDKARLLNNVDVIANMQYAFRNDFQDGTYQSTKFRFEQFRAEIKGYVGKKLYFRFRHRYTSGFEPQDLDKIVKGVDFAYLRLDLSPIWQLTVGKTFADWGGWEFDINPVEIYEYSDIIEQADNFLSGVGTYVQAMPNHGFSFQILNSRTGDFQTLYDTVPNVQASRVPLAAVVNWRGSFWDGRITTLWSYSLFNEAADKFKNYLALGTQYDSKDDRIHLAYDFKWSLEDLDRTGIISQEIPDNLYNYAVENTLYYSHWVHFEYRLGARRNWIMAFYGFIDFANWRDDELDPLKTENRFRTVYSVIPAFEFYPFRDVNLKFFVNYVGRFYRYSDYAKSRPGLNLQDFNTARVNIGFISPLLIL